MTDSMHQPRDKNGQFVSLETLVERERQEHMKDHEKEHIVAKETAQRLEREVEQTALTLERVVEVTATRIESGVKTALAAVADKAAIHSEAHKEQHAAHEQIHTVEKNAVEKAEKQQKARDEIQAESLKEYKQANNEWGRTVRELTAEYPTRKEIDARFLSIEKDIKGNTVALGELRETVLTRFAGQGGKSEGITATAKAGYMILAAVGIIIGIVSTIIALTL